MEQLDESRFDSQTVKAGVEAQPQQPVRPFGEGPVEPGQGRISIPDRCMK